MARRRAQKNEAFVVACLARDLVEVIWTQDTICGRVVRKQFDVASKTCNHDVMFALLAVRLTKAKVCGRLFRVACATNNVDFALQLLPRTSDKNVLGGVLCAMGVPNEDLALTLLASVTGWRRMVAMVAAVVHGFDRVFDVLVEAYGSGMSPINATKLLHCALRHGRNRMFNVIIRKYNSSLSTFYVMDRVVMQRPSVIPELLQSGYCTNVTLTMNNHRILLNLCFQFCRESMCMARYVLSMRYTEVPEFVEKPLDGWKYDVDGHLCPRTGDSYGTHMRWTFADERRAWIAAIVAQE
jgi:hypothetical protein